MTGFIREQIVKRTRRSSGWRKVRNWKIKNTPYCQCCGRKKRLWNLQVHHIEDFSTHPEKELEPDNLMSLCGRCHLLVGHLNNWKSINPDVATDAMVWNNKIENRRAV